jgi:hypothetical protein
MASSWLTDWQVMQDQHVNTEGRKACVCKLHKQQAAVHQLGK